MAKSGVCLMCPNFLTGQQKKFCSYQCSKLHFDKFKGAYRIGFAETRKTPLLFPGLIKPGKGKVYKQKKVTRPKKTAPKLPKRNRSTSRWDDSTESEMWIWYWDVKHHIEPLEKNMKQIWKYYDYLFKNETFINNKST